MAKITLPNTDSGYNISTINDNFQAIAEELNTKVLYRDNPPGEPNTLETDLDANSNRVYNLAEPINNNDAARLQDVQNAISGATAANLISVTPAGSISSTNVQAALQELDTDISGKLSLTGGELTGNLTFTGNALRLVADLTNATIANRFFIQTSAIDSVSRLGVIPAGTANASALEVYNNSNPANAGTCRVVSNSMDSRIESSISGSGTYLPLTFWTNNAERMRISTLGVVDITATGDSLVSSIGASGYGGFQARGSGTNPAYMFFSNATNAERGRISVDNNATIAFSTNAAATERLQIRNDSATVIAVNSNGLGYGSGSGSSITQTTSKSNPVTINKPTGRITLNSAALAANTTVSFTVNCTQCDANDIPVVAIQSNSAAYTLTVSNVNSGSFVINVRNITAGSLSEGFLINYAIIKGSIT